MLATGENWEKEGRNHVRKCLERSSGKLDAGDLDAHKVAKKLLYDICRCVVIGRLKVDQAAASLADAVEINDEYASIVADVFLVFDCEVAESTDERSKLHDLMLACVNFVPDCLYKERFHNETLEKLGMIPSAQQAQSKYVKTKTKLYYKQQKFNLLREESEGYSKLYTELCQEVEDSNFLLVLENIKSLVGCFDLDPLRVLDIILDAFECRIALQDVYLPLIRSYTNDHMVLCQVLGHKFHFYQDSGTDVVTPTSLYDLAAIMLQTDLIELDALYPHLMPSDKHIVESHKRETSQAKDYSKKGQTSLVDKDAQSEKKDPATKDETSDVSDNQKLGLIEALLRQGSWEQAKLLMARLPPFYATSREGIGKPMCSLVHNAIEPLYRSSVHIPLLSSSAPYDVKSGVITPVKSFSQLSHQVFPMLRSLGPHLHYDTALLVKLLRIGRVFMHEREKSAASMAELQDVYYGFMTILEEVILPTTTLIPSNCGVIEEVWAFVRLLKYEHRYRLYGTLKNETYSLHAKMLRARANCLERAKYIMKRLSKENVKPLGRQLGKLAHSNPGIVFEHILSQIQKYDNFISPVVDSLKFLTPMGFDVLAYCIIESLANPDKERMKTDDTNLSLWLQSLASFSGCVFKKYQIDLSGLLQYVANQLKAGKSYDLLILREIIAKMVGIEMSEELTNDQLEALSGGDILKNETQFGQVRNTKKSSSRLKDSLKEENLAIPLALLMAQQRAGILFTGSLDDQRHLKLVGKLYDTCQDTMVQFTQFLSQHFSVDEVRHSLPKISDLLQKYNIPAEAAFALIRPVYANTISARYEEKLKGEVKGKDKDNPSQLMVQCYLEASQKTLEPVSHLIEPIYEPSLWKDLSSSFYTTFWTLEMYDLEVPTSSYTQQLTHIRQNILNIEDNKDMNTSKKKKEKERCAVLIDKLNDEERKQQEHVTLVLSKLKEENHNCAIVEGPKNNCVSAFLRLCIWPRCTFTASDASYCAKFIHVLHTLKTPNFFSLICFDRIFCDITYSVASCTENEAHRYGRFLSCTLSFIMYWHSDQTVFEKECASVPGFVTVIRAAANNPGKANYLDYENFRHVCHKWHFSITKSMVTCIESGTYIQIRNALIVLTKILPHYPRVVKFGQALERRVDRLCQDEKDKRQDVYAIAMGYIGQMKQRKKHWIPEKEFHQVKKKASQPSLSSVSSGNSSSKTSNGKSEGDNQAKEKASESDVAADSKRSQTNSSGKEGEIKRREKSKQDGTKSDKQGENAKLNGATSTDMVDNRHEHKIDSGRKELKETAKSGGEYTRTEDRKRDATGNKCTKEDVVKIKRSRVNVDPKLEDDKPSKEKLKEVKEKDKHEDTPTRSDRREVRMQESSATRRRVEDRDVTSSSGGSSERRRTTAVVGDSSPRVTEEGLKRRKVEMPTPSSAKDSSGHRDRDKHKTFEDERVARSRERTERKRNTDRLSDDREQSEAKRYRSADDAERRGLNGEPAADYDKRKSPSHHELRRTVQDLDARDRDRDRKEKYKKKHRDMQ